MEHGPGDAVLTDPWRDRERADRIALANLQKGNNSITDYVGKIRTLCDELVAAGKRVDEEDVVSHILAGLEEDFDPVVSAMCSRVEPVTVPELYSQLDSFKTRMNLRHGGSQSSANAATRGRGRGGGDRGRGNFNKQPNRGNMGGNNGGGGGNYNNNPSPKPTCQIFGKIGQPTWRCCKWYDPSYQEGEERSETWPRPSMELIPTSIWTTV